MAPGEQADQEQIDGFGMAEEYFGDILP